jgi:hypothetical protein
MPARRKKPADGAAPARKPAARPRGRRGPTSPAAAGTLPAGASGRPLDEATRSLEGIAERLDALSRRLESSLGETPKPADFQPLADHLYEFARTAPAVVESLRELPGVAGPLGENVRALQDIAETLASLHAAFTESLIRLPQAEDYEPLAEPLRRFAATSPGLVAALGEVLQIAGPLADSVRGLRELAGRLEASHERLAAARPTDETPVPGDSPSSAEGLEALTAPLREFVKVSPALVESLRAFPRLASPLAGWVSGLEQVAARLEAASRDLGASVRIVSRASGSVRREEVREALERIASARATLVEALESLPRGAAYAPLARQLREIATVSPSLMAWLEGVPAVTAPLEDSVRGLWEAAGELKEAQLRLEGVAERLGDAAGRDGAGPSPPKRG